MSFFGISGKRFAIKEKRIDILQVLIDHNLDINRIRYDYHTKYAATLINEAISAHFREAVNLLISHKVSFKHVVALSPLQVAVKENFMINEILEHSDKELEVIHCPQLKEQLHL